jgi:hypothetical protein
MNKLEKLLKDNCYLDVNNHIFKQFKKDRPKLFKVVLNTLNQVNLKHIQNDNLVLIKHDIDKITFKIGVPKMFIFCGAFLRADKEIILLELVDELGTYYFDNNNLTNKLRDYKIGTKVQIEKVVKDKIEKFNLLLPYDSSNIGLFAK